MTDNRRTWAIGRREKQRQANRAELLRLYEIAVEEYRFQVRLNWNRAQYLLGFNTAVIAVGAGLSLASPQLPSGKVRTGMLSAVGLRGVARGWHIKGP